MKKIDIKSLCSVTMAVIMGIATFATAISDNEKTKKMDELIKKVEELTDKE